ncbi:MAG: FAD-dependent oxidoreductase, partial [Pseudomonadales bacterium]
AVGPDFVVGTRVGPHDFPGGLNVDEHVDIVRRVLQERLIDYLNVSHGSALNSHKIIGAMHEDTGYELASSVPITRLTDLPTLVTGRFLSLADADRIVAAGDADLVGMTRAHIADPDMVRKSVAGRSHEVRPCIGCNQGCVGGLAKGRIGCAVNPAAGWERILDEALVTRASARRRVLVAGGGPAGLEAARLAALRGHAVTVVEAAGRLGGKVVAARQAPRHADIGRIVDWLAAEIDRLGVSVRLGRAVDDALLAELAPDALVVATGAAWQAARPGSTPLGDAPPHVLSAEALLTGQHNAVGQSAVVVDEVGGYEAIGAAEFLVTQGVSVTFVTPLDAFAPLLVAAGVARPAWERLSASGRFRLVTRGRLVRAAAGQAAVASLDGWPDLTVPADTLVPVSAGHRDEALAAAARQRGIEVHVVGDAAGAGLLPGAIESGHRAGRSL